MFVVTKCFSGGPRHGDHEEGIERRLQVSTPLSKPLRGLSDFFLFRIYDKEGQGYITNETLRSLIGELLAPLTDEELDGIIDELDEDGSGTMDFDEFCEMMMTKPDGGD